MTFALIGCAIASFSVGLLVGSLVVIKSEKSDSSQWGVEILPTAKWIREYEYGRRMNVSETVQVRLVKGKQDMLIETVSVNADDFDEQLYRATTRAQERASTLNAMVSA